MDVVVAPGTDHVNLLRDDEPMTLPTAELPGWVADQPADTRWVWADSSQSYPALLRAGVRVDRAVDLRLVHQILRRAHGAAGVPIALAESSAWDAPAEAPLADTGPTLFDSAVTGPGIAEVLAEHRAQRDTLAAVTRADGGRLRLLCHAESIGGLIAQELNQVGVPFDVEHHDRQLRTLLGEPDPWGGRPALMERLVGRIRAALDARDLNPDSAVELLKALRRAGLQVSSTRQWELEQLDHPVVEPLLAYKKLARLHSANGWAWLASWVREGRFRSDWVAGGVVTGRWASRGGGALQLPRQIRGAVRAEPGWTLVVADAAQLEPRVLAAMAADEQMAAACQGADLYQGLVDQGVIDTREHAKIAVLAAMYGSTSGEAGALLPRLARAYPKAMGVVEGAARAGERGEQVTTWLGRTSPAPHDGWQEAQAGAQQPDAGVEAERWARRASRDWGRFTRNFVVQGTAAEWALCWLGHLRRALTSIRSADGTRPELVYFLHDEVMVHAPVDCAEAVADAVREAAHRAGALLFGSFGVEFALNVAVVDSYDQAK
ncbi:bifunctional 3'-5' exonuclease/DNA polymerase [Microlunatus sp. Y2014]|uniref:bifunctional 3'-5' exonuclease/DNA polymerase n=1 Tax=Microlunatus sp. Y2014 TaxID=3418488 RepID=UPI003DA79656